MFREYTELLEAQLEVVNSENMKHGVLFPFLVKNTRVIAAKLISTRRNDKFNVCFACVKNLEDPLPNGIFISCDENEVEEKYGLSIKYLPMKVSKVEIVVNSEGLNKIALFPVNKDFSAFFRSCGAYIINDLRAFEYIL
jgi:hypothetical protein